MVWTWQAECAKSGGSILSFRRDKNFSRTLFWAEAYGEAFVIYLITQEMKFGQYLSDHLREQGYEVTVADEGTAGGREVVQESPELVLIDLYLKNPSGLEVLRLIRNGGYKGKIILLAGVSISRILPEAFHFGIHQVIGGHDPVDLGPLECAIRSALEGNPHQEHLSPS